MGASAESTSTSGSGVKPASQQIFKKVVYNMIDKKEYTATDMFQYLRKNKGNTDGQIGNK